MSDDLIVERYVFQRRSGEGKISGLVHKDMANHAIQAAVRDARAEVERAATERIAELEDTARQALDFASDMMQNLGWARQQGEDLSRELDENEADAYKLFHACWDALRMGPQRKYAKGERRAG